MTWRRAQWLCPLLGASLTLPFLIDQNAWKEWVNHFWLLKQQISSVQAGGHPSFFVHVSDGVFYPQFLFYGGTLYALAAYIALGIGSDWIAFAGWIVLAFAMAYGGTYWLAREAAVRPPLSHLVALVTVTSASYVSTLYGDGGWAALVAKSAVPVICAASVSLARRSRLSMSAAAALVGASVILGGSHNITLLWGGVFMLTVLALSTWAFRPPLSRVAAILLLAAAGVWVNLWFLLPDAWYSRDTAAYADAPTWIGVLWPFDRASVIFHPTPFVPAELRAVNPAEYVQAPLYPLLWAVVTIAFLARRVGSAAYRRVAIGLIGLFVALASLMIVDRLWSGVPRALLSIQFPYRLGFFLALVTVGLVVVALVVAQQAPHSGWWVGGLCLAVAVQTGFAAYEAWSARAYVPRSAVSSARRPPTYDVYQRRMYRFVGGSTTASADGGIWVAPTAARTGKATIGGRTSAPVALYGTNVVWSPLVVVTGDARIVGRDEGGNAVIEARAGPRGWWTAEVRSSSPRPVRAGLVGTLVVLLLLGGGAVTILVSRARGSCARRRAARGASGPPLCQRPVRRSPSRNQ